MKNQMEKKMDNEMETLGPSKGYTGALGILYRVWVAGGKSSPVSMRELQKSEGPFARSSDIYRPRTACHPSGSPLGPVAYLDSQTPLAIVNLPHFNLWFASFLDENLSKQTLGTHPKSGHPYPESPIPLYPHTLNNAKKPAMN